MKTSFLFLSVFLLTSLVGSVAMLPFFKYAFFLIAILAAAAFFLYIVLIDMIAKPVPIKELQRKRCYHICGRGNSEINGMKVSVFFLSKDKMLDRVMAVIVPPLLEHEIPVETESLFLINDFDEKGERIKEQGAVLLEGSMRKISFSFSYYDLLPEPKN